MKRKYLRIALFGVFTIAIILTTNVLYAHADDSSTGSGDAIEVRERLTPKNILPIKAVPIRMEMRMHDDYPIKARYEFENGVHKMEGFISASACQRVETGIMIAESYPEQVTLEFKLVDTTTEDIVCPAVMMEKKFELKFEASEEARIEAMINGNPAPIWFMEEDDINEPIRDRVREEAQITNNERAEEMEQRREENKQRIGERNKERAGAYLERMVERINSAFERMEKLIERMESRIQKLDENGLDTTEASRLTAEAKTKLAEGKAAFEEATENIKEAINNGEGSKELIDLAKESMRTATESLKEVKELLKDAVVSIKAEASNSSTDSEDGEETENE